MGFEIDGQLWQPETTTQHATAWLEGINELLEENNITDENGNVIQLSPNFANALYLQILAGANRLSDNDIKLQSAINSFNIEACDDQQIENLLPIAALTRNPGSYSQQTISVTASADGACIIPQGARLPFNDVFFVVQEEITVPAGETENIITICNTIGPIVALAGEITSFENQIPNLQSVINPVSSIPGVNQETTNSLRQKIASGETVMFSLDGCKTALEGLTGITYARVYFNYNNTEPLVLPGGVTVAPRIAYLVIFGESEKIAETYVTYESAPTQNGQGSEGTASTMVLNVTASADDGCVIPEGTTVTYDNLQFEVQNAVTILSGQTQAVQTVCTEVGANEVPSNVITAFDQAIDYVATITNEAAIPGINPTAMSQTWYTESGQPIEIKYDNAKEQQIYVKITLQSGADSTEQVQNQLKRDLIQSSAEWNIGEAITSLLTSSPFINCTYTSVAYTEVSTDGENWEQIITTSCNVIPRIKGANITVAQL